MPVLAAQPGRAAARRRRRAARAGRRRGAAADRRRQRAAPPWPRSGSSTGTAGCWSAATMSAPSYAASARGARGAGRADRRPCFAGAAIMQAALLARIPEPRLGDPGPPRPAGRRRRPGGRRRSCCRARPRGLFLGIYQDRGKIALGVGLIFAILLVLAGLLSRGIARPIEALGAATRECRARRRSTIPEPPVDRGDRDPRPLREFRLDGRRGSSGARAICAISPPRSATSSRRRSPASAARSNCSRTMRRR